MYVMRLFEIGVTKKVFLLSNVKIKITALPTTKKLLPVLDLLKHLELSDILH